MKLRKMRHRRPTDAATEGPWRRSRRPAIGAGWRRSWSCVDECRHVLTGVAWRVLHFPRRGTGKTAVIGPLKRKSSISRAGARAQQRRPRMKVKFPTQGQPADRPFSPLPFTSPPNRAPLADILIFAKFLPRGGGGAEVTRAARPPLRRPRSLIQAPRPLAPVSLNSAGVFFPLAF